MSPLRLPDSSTVLPLHEELCRRAQRTTPEDPSAAQLQLVEKLVEAGSETLAYALVRDANWVNEFDPDLRGRAAVACARTLYRTKHWDELAQLVQIVEALDLEPVSRARVLLVHAWAKLVAGEREAAADLAREAARCAQGQSSLLAKADLAYYRAYDLAYGSGGNGEAAQSIDLAVALYRHEGDRYSLVPALLLASIVRKNGGNLDRATHIAHEALTLAAENGNVEGTIRGLKQVAIYLYRQSEFARSLEAVDRALELNQTYQGATWAWELYLTRARVCIFLLRMNEAAAALDRAEQELGETEDSRSRAIVAEYRGMIELHAGRFASARACFDAAAELAQDAGNLSYERAERLLWQAETCSAEAEYAEAYELAGEGLDVLEKSGDHLERGQLLRVRAVAAYFLGDREEAQSLLHRAEQATRSVHDRYELGRVLLARAELSTSPLDAGAAAAEALHLFRGMGVDELHARAGELLEMARSRSLPSPNGNGNGKNGGHAGSDAAGKNAVVAASPAMKEVLARARKIAQHPSAVLITGETGVGKEVVANYVHDHSGRSERPFVPVNCAALPDALFESELFGNVKGAFTDATTDRQGLVEYARGGTLFLDEIGELPLPMQAKLLRLLQEGTYRRVGEVKEREADVRILAATNRDLSECVEAKTFRQDLFYRLRVFELEIPPLRDRHQDIRPLSELFVEKQSQILGRPVWIEPGVLRLFGLYRWPGNVRELDAAIIASAALADEHGALRVEDLPKAMRDELTQRKPSAGVDLLAHIAAEERRLILLALERTSNKADAARYLGISRATLYEKLKKLKLGPSEEGSSDGK